MWCNWSADTVPHRVRRVGSCSGGLNARTLGTPSMAGARSFWGVVTFFTRRMVGAASRISAHPSHVARVIASSRHARQTTTNRAPSRRYRARRWQVGQVGPIIPTGPNRSRPRTPHICNRAQYCAPLRPSLFEYTTASHAATPHNLLTCRLRIP